jgi:hypothetical protein
MLRTATSCSCADTCVYQMLAAVACGSLDQWVEVGTDSAALNTALLQWTNNGCAGTIVFTSDGATLRYLLSHHRPWGHTYR